MLRLVLLAAALLTAAGLSWSAVRGRRQLRGDPTPEEWHSWRLQLPRDTGFGVTTAAAWFASLAPLLNSNAPGLSVELRGAGREVTLHVRAPRRCERPLQGQLAAWLPGSRLEPEEEEAMPGGIAAVPLRLEKPDLYPIRVPGAKEPDPLLGLIGAMTSQEEPCGLRIAWGRGPADWSDWAPMALAALRSGKRLPPRGGWFRLFQIFQWFRPDARSSQESRRRSGTQARELAGATAKAHDAVFTTGLLVWAMGRRPESAAERATVLANQLSTGFRDPLGNTLLAARAPRHVASLTELNGAAVPAVVLSAAELGTLFHRPETEYPLVPAEISRCVAPSIRLVRSPGTEQEPICCLGEALTPECPVPFGLTVPERRQHLYVVGKTGTGKSTLLATLAAQDLAAGRGLALLDPHGDLAERVLAFVPPERADQLCYFDPADRDFPIGLNLLASRMPAERSRVASSLVGVFKKLSGEFWGPRLAYILRHAILAVLETPAPTLLVVPRFLSDREYRTLLLPYVRDPIVRDFFTGEFESYDGRWRTEALSAVLNKVGQFLTTPDVRHIVGQRGAGVDLRRLMDDGGILIANLSVGRLGEDSAALLGGLLVAGFELVARSRADQPEVARRDFSLFVDEFQHFAGDTFASILAEARKFRLSLTLSHQFLHQVPPALSEAVLGNVGSLAVFRVGAPDAALLAREFAPIFDVQDLVHLPDHRFSARVHRDGETLPPFSAQTIPLPPATRDVQPLIERSRRRFARPRAEVELEIADSLEGRVD